MTATTLLAAGDIFTTGHIAVTALITGAGAFLGSLLLLGRKAGFAESLALALLAAAAVFLWRKSANMPQLNSDGLHGFSANDWLAPAITFVVLSMYATVRRPQNARRFAQAIALSALVAFVVNVITI